MPTLKTPQQPDEKDQEQQELFDRVNSLQSRLMLSEPRSAIDRAQGELETAQKELEEIRRHSHRFDKDLEQLLSQHEPGIEKARKALEVHLDNINRTIRPELDSITKQLQAASSSGWNASSLRSRVDNAEKMLEVIEKGVSVIGGDNLDPLYQACNRIHGLAWAYQQLDDASFNKEQGEELVSAWQAQWLAADEKSGPWGVLYLTSKRVIFEQKEKVKTGGLFSKKELRQMLAFWQPVDKLSRSVDSEKKKFLGKKEILSLEFSEGDPLKVNLRLKTDSNAVDKRIEDFVAGRLD